MNDSISPIDKGWKGVPNKRNNDTAVLQEVIPALRKHGTMHWLVLPATSWKMEEITADLYKSSRFVFHGIERNPEVWAKSYRKSKRMKKKNASFSYPFPDSKNISVSQHIELASANDIRYNMIYLDLMGTWNQTTRRDVKAIFSRGVTSNESFMWLTLMLPRGQRSVLNLLSLKSECEPSGWSRGQFALHKFSEQSNTHLIKSVGVDRDIKDMARTSGCSVKLMRFGSYRDSVTTQMSFLYRVRRFANHQEIIATGKRNDNSLYGSDVMPWNTAYFDRIIRETLAKHYGKVCPKCKKVSVTRETSRDKLLKCPTCKTRVSAVTNTPLRKLCTPLWMAGFVMNEMLTRPSNDLGGRELTRKLGITGGTATKLMERTKELLEKIKPSVSNEKAVVMIDTREITHTWRSASAAARALGMCHKAVSAKCQHNRTSKDGRKWRYV